MAYCKKLIIAVLLAGIPLLAQAPGQRIPILLPAGSGLSVDGFDYDQASRTVTISLRNSGKLGITAFGWSVNIQRSGSSTFMHSETVDILPELVSSEVAAQFGGLPSNRSFGPGETYSLKWLVPLHWGRVDSDSLTCEVNELVVYSDSSALGDTEAIEQVFARRRAEVADQTDTVAQVRRVPRDREGGPRLAALRDDLEKQDITKAGNRVLQRASLMRQLLSTYQIAGWAGIDGLSQIFKARAKAMSLQSYRKVN